MKKIIAVAGNPNVGKSTLFNALTGLNQHTGNWIGKTVENTMGHYTYKDTKYTLVDIPGTYSLIADSKEEEVARDYICFGESDLVVVLADATCLERNLNLVLQILEVTPNVIVCVNLIDEAKRKGISIDCKKLSKILGVGVVATNASKGEGLHELMKLIANTPKNQKNINPEQSLEKMRNEEEIIAKLQKCKKIAEQVVEIKEENKFDRKIDRILTSKSLGIPIMLILLGLVFWITLSGANYPSSLLYKMFFWGEDKLLEFATYMNTPQWLSGILISGVYRTLAWVVSVMVPPMAIFFPLFTILEDSGYLPRIAFNLDNYFKKACACGKQALTMCMGFGCNAVGVMGCRIIQSPRERLIAIITNNFVPCNGRYPTLIAIITMFFVLGINAPFQSIVSVLMLTAVILLGIIMTFAVSKLLAKTVLKGEPSSFVLELPPYRKPKFARILVRSIFDRTLFVLWRAVIVAAPAGAVIWLLANINMDGASLLTICAKFLNPLAYLMGLDGYILMAFILGFPANEIVLPIIIMSYLAGGNIIEMNNLTGLRTLLISNGWTWVTAICTMLFSLFHWPCGTTLLTIKKETQSPKWTLLSVILPTVIGMVICIIIASIGRCFL